MQGSVFISYRREDTAGYARSLYDRLKASFPDRIFIDVGAIPPGADFVKTIEQNLDGCAALIALIGDNWAAHDRMDDPADFVRLEIATALRRDISVIPVLVRNAKLPPAATLPQEIQPLLRHQTISISDEYWDQGCERLVQALEGAVGVVPKRPNVAKRWGLVLAATAIVVLSLVLVIKWRNTAGPALNHAAVASTPQLTSISAASGPPGAHVIIMGMNFGATKGTSTVRFGSVTATIIQWSENSITATVPALAPGPENIAVSVNGVDSTSMEFAVTNEKGPVVNKPAASSAEYQRVKDRFMQTQAQAQAVLGQWNRTATQVGSGGGSLRSDEQTALNLLRSSMNSATRSLQTGDLAGAAHSLDTADQQMKLLQQYAE